VGQPSSGVVTIAFSAAHFSSTITLSSATPNLFFSGSNVQMNSTDMTGSVAV
jgi:hypothetical protein